MAAEPTTTSEVRDRILDEHRELRVVLATVEELARRVQKGETEGIGALRERGFELHRRLCEHLELEERILMPAIRTSGGEGPEREEELMREHEEQRTLLEYVLERLRDHSRPATILGRELTHLSELLRDDMSYEESVVLSQLGG